MIGGEKEFGEHCKLYRKLYFKNAFTAFQTFLYIYSTYNREFEVVKSCVRVDLRFLKYRSQNSRATIHIFTNTM